jgi:hypothetical protein
VTIRLVDEGASMCSGSSGSCYGKQYGLIEMDKGSNQLNCVRLNFIASSPLSSPAWKVRVAEIK